MYCLFWFSLSLIVTVTLSFYSGHGTAAPAASISYTGPPTATAIPAPGHSPASPQENPDSGNSAHQNPPISPDRTSQERLLPSCSSPALGMTLSPHAAADAARITLLKEEEPTTPRFNIATTIAPLLGSPIAKAYLPAIERARSEINDLLSANGATSATVSIMDNGQIVYSEQFGMRDRAQSLPVDGQTQFNIGSISKVFTAAAILTLVDQGLVELDLPVTTYVPQFTMPQDLRYKKITVRMLLNHSSGLPGTNFRKGFGSQKNLDYSNETLTYLENNRLKHEPGTLSVYCNDGFTLAKALIEQVTGTSYADYLRQKIITPLTMGRTSCFFAEGDGNIAQIFGESGQPMPVEYVSAMGTGGLSSITDDLCRFSRILYSDSNLLSPGSLAEYRKAQYGPETSIGERPFFNFGLGWDYTQIREFAEQHISVLGKSGGTIWFSSFLMVAPEVKLTVAVLFAGAGVDTAALTSTIMQALLEGKNIVPKQDSPPSTPDSATIPAAILPFAGIYGSSSALMKFAFNTDDNTLETSSWDGRQFLYSEAAPYKADGYFHSESGSKFWFKEYEETKYLLNAVGENYVSHIVAAEHLTPVASPWTGAAFDNKSWLFRNGMPYEFILDIPATETLEELPGHITFGGVIYVLQSETVAEMALQYGRDLVTIELLDSGGEQWLSTGNFLYSNSDDVAIISNGEETISIGLDGWNEWRKTANQATLTSSIPANSRIMIFSEEKELIFDTLTDATFPLVVPEGSYLAFLGDPGDNFIVTMNY